MSPSPRPSSPTLSLGVHSCRCPNHGTEAHADAHDPESTANQRGPLSTSSHVGYSVRDPDSQERSGKAGELILLQPSHVPQYDRSEKKREVLPKISSRRRRRLAVISGLTSIPLAWHASMRSYIAYVLAGMRCFSRAFMSLERGLRLSQVRSLPWVATYKAKA